MNQTKDILIEFLNALFEGQKEITGLTYISTEHAGDKESLKKTFFDFYVPATMANNSS